MSQPPAPLGPKHLTVTGPARADMDELLAYIAAQAGLDPALRFADTLDGAFAKLAFLGHAGVSREWIKPGLRMAIVGSYCVYFRVSIDETRILRVLHGARDIDAIIFEGDVTE